MQTFMPYACFALTARCLDYKRLGKQRVECKQILQALLSEGRRGWSSHPAVLQWKGYEASLCEYAIWICAEWRLRGFRDSLLDFFMDKQDALLDRGMRIDTPSWLGNAEYHASYRSNLLRKDPAFYSRYGWVEPPDLEYVWPGKILRKSI